MEFKMNKFCELRSVASSESGDSEEIVPFSIILVSSFCRFGRTWRRYESDKNARYNAESGEGDEEFV